MHVLTLWSGGHIACHAWRYDIVPLDLARSALIFCYRMIHNVMQFFCYRMIHNVTQ